LAFHVPGLRYLGLGIQADTEQSRSRKTNNLQAAANASQISRPTQRTKDPISDGAHSRVYPTAHDITARGTVMPCAFSDLIMLRTRRRKKRETRTPAASRRNQTQAKGGAPSRGGPPRGGTTPKECRRHDTNYSATYARAYKIYHDARETATLLSVRHQRYCLYDNVQPARWQRYC
jgi:hypothetical protein